LVVSARLVAGGRFNRRVRVRRRGRDQAQSGEAGATHDRHRLAVAGIAEHLASIDQRTFARLGEALQRPVQRDGLCRQGIAALVHIDGALVRSAKTR
jgi:hypothetical protein